MHSFFNSFAMAAALAAGVASAIDAPSAVSSGINITVPGNTLLSVKWANTSILIPGIELQEQPVAKQPAVGLPSAGAPAALDKYTLIMIDPDIKIGDPAYQLLHYMLTNTTLDGGALEQDITTLVPYLSPTPSKGTAPVHNYTLMLFRQPPGFQIPAEFQRFVDPGTNSSKRLGFNVADFAAAGHLGDPVAANWFRVAIPGTNASSSAGGNSSSSSSSGSPYGSSASGMAMMPSGTGAGAIASTTASSSTPAFTGAAAPLAAAGTLLSLAPAALIPLFLM